MKKILFVAMAATMLAACTQNEELENATSNKEMKFNTAVMSTTRATVITTADFKRFTLYAYYGTADANEIIAGKEFVKDVSSSTWATNPAETFYWPGENNVNFWGYSAVKADGSTSTNITNYQTATKSFSYKVETASTDQEDLLVADVIQLNSKSSNGTASIPFAHALTKMSFKIIGQETSTDYSYEVSGISISANSTGTYSLLTTNGGWTNQATPATFTLTPPTSAISGTTATDLSETLMMMPQSSATLTVTYKVTAGGYTAENLSKTFTFDAWEKGKNMVYTITLPADAITPMKVEGTVTDGDWATNNTPNNGTLTPKTGA